MRIFGILNQYECITERVLKLFIKCMCMCKDEYQRHDGAFSIRY